MVPRKIVLNRPASILALSLVGWASAQVLVATFGSTLGQVADSLALLGRPTLIAIILILSVATSLPTCNGRIGPFLHGGHPLKHPPLWSAVAIGLLVHTTVGTIFSSLGDQTFGARQVADLSLVVGAMIAGAGIAVGFVLLGSPSTREATAHKGAPTSLEHLYRDPEALERWLDEDDEPISHPSQDLFGHSSVARRMAKRLIFDGAPSMLLRGPKGSGKTSILRLIEHYVRHPEEVLDSQTSHGTIGGLQVFSASTSRKSATKVRLVRVSAWTFEDSNSLLHGVLSKIVSETHKVADAYALTGLPAAYLAAISTSRGWFAGLGALLSPSLKPEQAFDRVSSILTAVNVRLVVWLDDLERFREGKDHSDESIKALFALVRGRANLSFVLAEAWVGESDGGFDYPKLCAFTEFVPKMQHIRVAEVVSTLRNQHRSNYGDIDPKNTQQNDPFAPITAVEHMFSGDRRMMTMWSAVGRSIGTPRMLKSVLRRLRESWKQLHGEVDFDELLVTLLLNESDRAVVVGKAGHRFTVIDLIDGNLSWLRERIADRAFSNRRQAPLEQEQALLDLFKADGDVEGKLLSYLFGALNQRHRPQSVAADSPTDYWARIRSEGINERTRDQTVIARIDQVGTDDGRSLTTIVDWLLVDGEEARKVRQFVHRLGGSRLIDVAREVLERLLADPRSIPVDDHHHPEGLVNLARLFMDIWIKPEKRLVLVRNAISRAIPLSLALAFEIEYWLVARPGTVSRSTDSEADRDEIALHGYRVFAQSFSGPDGAGRLITALSAERPWELSWILNRNWDESRKPPAMDATLAASIADILVVAAEQSPRFAGRALAIALSDSGMTFNPHFDDESGTMHRGHEWKSKFNEQRARVLLGNHFDRAMNALAAVPLDGVDGEAAASIIAVVEYATRWVAQTSKPARRPRGRRSNPEGENRPSQE